MPVFPDVGSTITPPFFNTPRRSASSIIAMPMRSLMLAPGFARSSLSHTSTPGYCEYRRLRRTCGVLPIVSRMLLTRMEAGTGGRVKGAVGPWKLFGAADRGKPWDYPGAAGKVRGYAGVRTD